MFSAESFMYDFAANGQAGTYWYHSHQCKIRASHCFAKMLTARQLLNTATASGDPWLFMIPTTPTRRRMTSTMVCFALIIVTLSC
jgi:hypothetical protein